MHGSCWNVGHPANSTSFNQQLYKLPATLSHTLCAGTQPAGPSILDKLPVITKCFAQPSMAAIMEALRSDDWDSAFSLSALELMAKSSPLSLAVTLELFNRSSRWDLATCFQAEYVLVTHFVHGEGDFFEGVRAMLIDRGSTPQWRYSKVEEVPPDVVQRFFVQLESHRPLRLDEAGKRAADSRL